PGFEEARFWCLLVLSGGPEKCPQATERLCYPGRSGEGLHPYEGPNRALVRDRKRRACPSDVGSILPVLPVCSQAREQDFFPPPMRDRFRYAETWRGPPQRIAH